MRFPTISFILVLLLGACAAPQAPLPEQNYFRLAPADAGMATGTPLVNGLLMVEEPRSDGLHSERALIFSDDSDHRRMNQYHYDYWTDPPTRLVQGYLVQRLRGAGAARQVMRYDTNSSADAYIGGRLQRLVQLIDGDHTRVVVEMELRLSYPAEARPRLLRDYRAEVTVVGSRPEDSISGYEQALNDIIARFVNDARATAGTTH